MLKVFRFENMLLEHGEAVSCRTKTGALDIVGIIARTGIVIVPTLADAILDDNRKKRSRCVLGEHTIDVVADPHLGVDDEIQLPGKGLVKLFVTGKVTRLARLNPRPLTGHRVDAVVQCDLQNLRHIQVAGQNISLLAEGTDFDAATAAPSRASLSDLP